MQQSKRNALIRSPKTGFYELVSYNSEGECVITVMDAETFIGFAINEVMPNLQSAYQNMQRGKATNDNVIRPPEWR